MIKTRLYSLIIPACTLFMSAIATADDVTVNAEARIYNPAIVYINPGDTVHWNNMTSHNSVTYVVPEGATGWGEHGQLPGASFSVTPEKEGIYGYVCEPHIGFGMVGVVVVGQPTAERKEAAMKTATDTLQGPFRRLIGTIKKVEVK